MIGGRVAFVSEIDGLEDRESSPSGRVRMDAPLRDRYSSVSELLAPLAPLVDDVAALAGLIHARMQLRGVVTGEEFPYRAARALAACLFSGRPVDYEQLQQVLGRGPGAVRATVQYLTRVGLLVESGGRVSLSDQPVKIEVFVGTGGAVRRVAPGDTPHLKAGECIRIVASSHLALEMRVFRVFHRLAGRTAMRSISMKCLSRRRPAVIELELDDGDGSEAVGVEQLLIHVGWSAMNLGAWKLDEPPSVRAPGTVGESVERERRDLCLWAGAGWVTEYLFPLRL